MANPRKTRTISQSERKSDERDALVLAPLGRADRNLLSPIVHGSEETQRDLLQIKLRDSLVRARVALITRSRLMPPSIFGARAARNRSGVRSESRASSSTMAE